MSRLLAHVRRQAVGYLALFVALGGTSYAAFALPKNSVGGRQIKNHSINPVKLNPKFTNGTVRAWAVVDSSGKVIAGGGKPEGAATATSGVYAITWGVNLKPNCATVATIDFDHTRVTGTGPNPVSGWASAATLTTGRGRFNNQSTVHTFTPSAGLSPLGFDIAVIC